MAKMNINKWISNLKKQKGYSKQQVDNVFSEVSSENGWDGLKLSKQQSIFNDRYKSSKKRVYNADQAISEAHDQDAQFTRNKILKDRLKFQRQNRTQTPVVDDVVKDQKYYDEIFNGQKYYDSVFRGEEFTNKTFNKKANKENRNNREQRVAKNLKAHTSRQESIQSVYEKTNGVYDKVSIGQAYGSISKRPEFANMSEFDLDNHLLRESEKRVINRRIGDSGYSLSDEFREEMYKKEQAKLQKELGDKRKSSKTQSSQSSTSANVEDEISATLADSVGDANTGAFDFKSIDTTGASRGGQYAFNKEANNVRFAEANLNRALTNEDVAKSLKGRLGIESDDQLKEIVNDPTKRNELFTNRLDSAKSNPTFMDNMMGNKVPHMAGGALLTAGLVSSLSSSKGQQSNAQLYGQQQPYY